ncbi:MAG: hypothetical protein WCT42_01980 [Candidatus Paceibacterota bacterium]
MRTYIKKLQSKPESTRKQIFFGSLIICMSFVCLIWISSLGHKFNNKTIVKTKEDIKPFALFGQTLSNTYNNVTASVGKISSPSKQQEEVKMKTKVETEKQVDLIPVEYQ